MVEFEVGREQPGAPLVLEMTNLPRRQAVLNGAVVVELRDRGALHEEIGFVGQFRRQGAGRDADPPGGEIECEQQRAHGEEPAGDERLVFASPHRQRPRRDSGS